MSTEQAGAVVVQVTARDFTRLCENSGRWAPWERPEARFEAVNGEVGEPSGRWEWIYWLGDNYAAVIFARAFLAARGFEYEVVYDLAQHPDGAYLGYALLTDYEEER